LLVIRWTSWATLLFCRYKHLGIKFPGEAKRQHQADGHHNAQAHIFAF